MTMGREDFRQSLSLVLFGIAVSIVTRAIAFVSIGHSLDDLRYWEVSSYSAADLIEHGYGEGRFVYPWLAQVAQSLGVIIPRSPTLSALILSASLALAGVLICYLWRIEKDRIVCALVVAVFVAHPYFTDIFLWKMAMFTAGIPFVVALLGMLIAGRSWPWAFIGGTLIVIALGVHQLPLPVCAAAWLIAVLFAAQQPTGRKERFLELMRIGITLATSAVIYILVAKLIIAGSGKPSPLNRDVLIVLSNPRLVLTRVKELVRMVLLDDLLIAGSLRMIIGALLTLTVTRLLVMSVSSRDFLAVCGALLFPAALFICVLAASALTAVPLAWTLSFRNLTAISVVWAGIAGACAYGAHRAVRMFTCIASAFVLFGFIGVGNEMLTDQERQSARDRALMARILIRLETLPAFSLATSVEFIGTNSSPLTGLRTAADISHGWGAYGSTFSPFAAFFGEQGYLQFLLLEVSGDRKLMSNITAHDLAHATCEHTAAWPAPASVLQIEETAIVCLGPPAQVTAGRFNL